MSRSVKFKKTFQEQTGFDTLPREKGEKIKPWMHRNLEWFRDWALETAQILEKENEVFVGEWE